MATSTSGRYMNGRQVGPRCVGIRQVGCARMRMVVRAEQAPASSGRTRVVSIGESLFDLIADQKGLPREKVKSWTPFAGGAPANVATSLAKLGLDVVFITALGRDAPGDQLWELLKECGVKLDAIQRRDEPTRDVYVVRDKNGDREFSGFGKPTETYADAFLDAGALPVNDIQGAALLVTGTLGLAYPGSRAAITRAVSLAKEGGCKVLVDVNWRPVFWADQDAAKKEILSFLQQADLIKLSDADMEALLGVKLSMALINPCVLSSHFPNARGVLITAGGEGAAYCFTSPTKGEHSGFVPVFKNQNIIDTTGAGDAFTAGFVYKLLQAGSLDALAADAVKLKEAVVFASAAGALTCTKKGAIGGQPTEAEVEALYETSKSWYNFW